MDKYIGKIPHFHGFEEHKTRTAVPYTDSSEIWQEGGHLQLASSCQFTFIGEAMWGLSPKTCQTLEFYQNKKYCSYNICFCNGHR